MRLRLMLFLVGMILFAAGCQADPPTVVYIVLSPTPETTGTTTAPAPITTTEESSEVTTTPLIAAATETPPPTDPLVTPTRTSLPPGFPTPTNIRIQVAEQLFENGRMFWLEPNREIWVLIVTGEGRGAWTVYQDTWTEGVDPESDETIIPPDGMLQPVRGFGTLWRTVPNLREDLGWAVSQEFGYLSDYQYVPGGTLDGAGVYTPGPGYHVVYSLYGEQFRFNEVDSTWQLGGA
mgnify:CR=1 FL=1